MQTFAVVLLVAVLTNIVVTLINCLLDSKVSFVIAENLRIQMDIDVYEKPTFAEQVDLFCHYLVPIKNVVSLVNLITDYNEIEQIEDNE